MLVSTVHMESATWVHISLLLNLSAPFPTLLGHHKWAELLWYTAASTSSLFIYLYMSMLLTILPSHSVLCLYVHFLWQHLYSCPANRCICTNFFFRLPYMLIYGICSSFLLRPCYLKMIIRGYGDWLLEYSTAATSNSTSSASTPRGTVDYTLDNSTSSPSMACGAGLHPGWRSLLRKSSPPPSRTVGAWPPAGCAGAMSARPGWDRAFSPAGKRVLINSQAAWFGALMHLDGKAKSAPFQHLFSCISVSPRGDFAANPSLSLWLQQFNNVEIRFSKNFS